MVLFEIRDILKFAVRRVKTALKDAEYIHNLLPAELKSVLFAVPLEYNVYANQRLHNSMPDKS